MILGTYWYFAFPEGLYNFEFFHFSEGRGGFADKPAQLQVDVYAEQPGKLISELDALVRNHQDAFLFIYRDGNKLRIGTGGFQLFDYDFLFILEVEKVLKKEPGHLLKNETLNDPELIHLQNGNLSAKMIYPEKGILQVVSSGMKKYNAENSMLRMDCHVKASNKAAFIAELKKVALEAELDVFYYYDQDYGDQTNLMLFFSNGRQGLNFARQKFTDTVSLENRVEELMKNYQVERGHGPGPYPQNGPNIELMVDEEYVL